MTAGTTSRRILLTTAVLLFCSTRVSADDPQPGINPDHVGYALYQSVCSECHGVRGDGQGPRAAGLQPPPPDHTQLRGADDWPMGRDDLARVIDGRRTFRAHGVGGMPVWGWIFVPGEPDEALRERARRQLINALAEYVVSIQRTGRE
jgi:mono/diheme cytochrome c family protein